MAHRGRPGRTPWRMVAVARAGIRRAYAEAGIGEAGIFFRAQWGVDDEGRGLEKTPHARVFCDADDATSFTNWTLSPFPSPVVRILPIADWPGKKNAAAAALMTQTRSPAKSDWVKAGRPGCACPSRRNSPGWRSQATPAGPLSRFPLESRVL